MTNPLKKLPESAVWIRQMFLCPACGLITKLYMDEDGNRYCGKCKKKVRKLKRKEANASQEN